MAAAAPTLSVLFLAAVVACTKSRRPVGADHVEQIVDVDDRCPNLPRHCIEGENPYDDDGCPDPIYRFTVPPDATALPQEAGRAIDAVAAEVHRLVADAVLVIAVEAAPGEPPPETKRRAALVEQALLARSVPRERIRVELDAPFSIEGTDPDPALVELRVSGCP